MTIKKKEIGEIHYSDGVVIDVDGDETGSVVTIDGTPTDLSIIQADIKDYCQKVTSGTVLSNEMYFLSSEEPEVNFFDQRITNVGDPIDEQDAVTKYYLEQQFNASSIVNALTASNNSELKTALKNWLNS